MSEGLSDQQSGQMPNSTPESMPDSMWALKPWWCQPWSILLTGAAIPAASWLLFHRLWITVPTIGAIAIWWLLFLVLVPGQYAAAVKAGKFSGS